MKYKGLLISFSLLLGVVLCVGWSFELPRIEETIGAGDLLQQGATYGAGLGLLIGLLLAGRAKRFIGKFQAVSSSILLLAGTGALLAHYSNRTIGSGNPEVVEMSVKQVTKMWNGRGITAEMLQSAPDGYWIFIETTDGLVRLLQPGAEAPDIGPSRSIAVYKEPGYWGYPRYSLSDG